MLHKSPVIRKPTVAKQDAAELRARSSEREVERVRAVFARDGRVMARDKIMPLFLTKMTEADIARELGVSTTMVNRLKKELMPDRPLYGEFSEVRVHISRAGGRGKHAKRLQSGILFTGKRGIAYDIIKGLLDKGVSPDAISPSIILASPLASDLSVDNVERVLAVLRKRGDLKRLSFEAASKLRSMVRQRTRSNAEKRYILARSIRDFVSVLRKKLPLRNVSSQALFIAILEDVLCGKNHAKIIASAKEAGFRIDVVDVAVVVEHARKSLQEMERKKDRTYEMVKDFLSRATVKHAFEECSRVLTTHSRRTDENIETICKNRLARLGEEIIL